MGGKDLKVLSKEELLDYKHYMTVGDLKKFLKENPDISDDSIVVAQRVEDIYYEKHNWGVYKHGGYHYHQSLQWNKDIDSGKYLDKEQYPNIEESNLVKFTEEDLDQLKNQYHPVWCCFRDKTDEGVVFLDLHY